MLCLAAAQAEQPVYVLRAQYIYVITRYRFITYIRTAAAHLRHTISGLDGPGPSLAGRLVYDFPPGVAHDLLDIGLANHPVVTLVIGVVD